ncbi:hypothetical protein DPMN_162879 [Dreissena polymorpha]|uniref:Uncharacterized protein n=1 Tax=Dreissena polymorpha TaxID=45954 RepID=A0A9D4ESI7_DREPO|nr:hypothetical protein DPMN_162879 [Dreissena polymorpha]
MTTNRATASPMLMYTNIDDSVVDEAVNVDDFVVDEAVNVDDSVVDEAVDCASGA